MPILPKELETKIVPWSLINVSAGWIIWVSEIRLAVGKKEVSPGRAFLKLYPRPKKAAALVKPALCWLVIMYIVPWSLIKEPSLGGRKSPVGKARSSGEAGWTVAQELKE